MENRIAVYHRLYVLCMAGMLPGLLLSIFLYIRWICMRCSDIFEENGVPVENVRGKANEKFLFC